MNVIFADFIFTCNEHFDIIENGAICFDKEIIDLGTHEEILKKYKNATHIHTPPNTVLMPGLVNPHVHLEFSANSSTLRYGDFITWLDSVIKYREELLENAKDDVIQKAVESMIKSGTTTFGAVSSFGFELDACIKTPARVVFFNEVLGSRPDAVDVLFNDFKQRLRHSEEEKSSTFIPAISVHSPYSTHPILAKNAIDIARKEDFIVSTHFMESHAEREWLDNGKGDFAKFFEAFNPNAKPFCNGMEYLELFKGTNALFTHTVQATCKEREFIANINGTITHCPRSNRLLGTGLMDLEESLKSGVNFTLGTDGLSSNTSLNLWDEMRTALMSHANVELTKLAKTLLQGVTLNGAKALNVNSGELAENKNADIIALPLKDRPKDLSTLPLHAILQTQETLYTFINGKEIK